MSGKASIKSQEIIELSDEEDSRAPLESSASVAISPEDQIVVFRIPKNVPMSALNSVSINLGKSIGKTCGKFKVEAKKRVRDYEVKQVNWDINAGDVFNSQITLPSAAKHAKINRVFNVGPLLHIPNLQQLAEEGQKVLEKTYVPRVQPESMQLCFKPFGFNTQEPALSYSLKRYKKSSNEKKKTSESTKKSKKRAE